jgi:hypothetical protein
MYFAWIGQEARLSPASLTVQAQTVSPNDNGQLLWDVFFPRQNVDSVKLTSIYQNDFRPVADRREWNARGRLIPQVTPRIDQLEMIPIESYFKLGEREIQDILERTMNNADIFRQLVTTSVPDRADGLVMANYRRVELDAFRAWALGTITTTNPQTGATGSFGFGFEASRYQTAAPAWTGGSAGTAYARLMTWLEEGIQKVGPISGIMLRSATMRAIIESAPRQFDFQNIARTRPEAERLVADQLGIGSFRFYINERTLETFATAGIARTSTYVWPANRVAIVPANDRVGTTAFAPVARAMEISRAVPAAKIDIRGQTVYHEVENNGRGLTVEAQVNALPMPEERLTFVINAGI